MKKITKLEIQKKNQNRVNLYVDDEFVCGLTINSVMDARLHVGDEISEETINSLAVTSDYQTALAKSLNYLTRAMRTVKQMRDYLAKKGYGGEVVDKVIEKLEEYKYIDDKAYASTYVECYSTGKGKRKISYELARKGISKQIIEQAVELLIPEQSEKDCLELAQKYVDKKQTYTQDNFSKLYRYLLSRGYEYDLVGRVIRQVKWPSKTENEDE